MAEKKKKKGVGEIARECLAKNMPFEKALAAVKKVHPESKFSKASYSWYKQHMAA